MTPWGTVRIADISAPGPYSVVGGPFGSALGRKDYVDEGVPVIRGAQLSGPSAFSNDDLVFVSEDKADCQKGNLAFPGDIIVTQRGTVGQIGRIPIDAPFPRYLLSQSQMKLTVDPHKADPRYVYYALLAPEAQHALRASTISAGVPHINLASFRALALPMPPLDIQSRISSVLDDLDRSIENHRLRIELLEQMAETLYREWFVRFRYPGHDTAAFVDSPLGSIPEDWTVLNLFEIADVGFGFSFKSPRFASSGPNPVIRIRDVPVGVTATFTDEMAPERYRVADGDVLVGMDGDFHLRQWTGGPAWLNQRVARLRPRINMASRHLMLAIAEPIKAWNGAITGTTVAHLGKRHLEQIHVTVPPETVLDHATPLFDSLAQMELALVQTNRRLSETRDLLLPRLVSGQIDVSHLDLDELVGSVA